MYVEVLTEIDKISQEALSHYDSLTKSLCASPQSVKWKSLEMEENVLDPYYINPMILNLGSLLWGLLSWIFFVQWLMIILFYCFLYPIIVLRAQLCILSSYVISVKSKPIHLLIYGSLFSIHVFWRLSRIWSILNQLLYSGYGYLIIIRISKSRTTIFIHLWNSKTYKCPLFLFFQSHWSLDSLWVAPLFWGFTCNMMYL